MSFAYLIAIATALSSDFSDGIELVNRELFAEKVRSELDSVVD